VTRRFQVKRARYSNLHIIKTAVNDYNIILQSDNHHQVPFVLHSQNLVAVQKFTFLTRGPSSG